jgi:ubiquinone/menaquinone biosynthesis C-methylase UbiE
LSISLKDKVHDHWNSESCGETYAVQPDGLDLSAQEKQRYELEPYILEFAHFEDGYGKDVLEIGVGMGADHLRWARHRPRSLTGVDLTERAIEFTSGRLASEGLFSDLRVADAEALPFDDGQFDLVYSWGVMHHSPNTLACFSEARRVLRPGGSARIMIYNKWSIVGLMLWARYALVTGHLLRSLEQIYADHLESPGTKAYTPAMATRMLKEAGFSTCKVRVQLSHGDLLQGAVGARHQGLLLRTAKALWPRPLFKAVGRNVGLYLLIEAGA